MAGKKKREHLHGELLFNVVSLLIQNIGKEGKVWVDDNGNKFCSYSKGCDDQVIADFADPKGRINSGQVGRVRVRKYGTIKRQPKPKVEAKQPTLELSSKGTADLYKAMRTIILSNNIAKSERKALRRDLAEVITNQQLLLSSLLPAKQVVLDLDNKPTDIYTVD
jgi:hypothetical protein